MFPSASLGAPRASGWSVCARLAPLQAPDRPDGLASKPRLRSSRKCCLGLSWSCLTLPNGCRGCSEAACALKEAAWARSQAAKSLQKLVRANSATTSLRKNSASHLEFGMRLKSVVRNRSAEVLENHNSNVLLEMTIRSRMSL